MKKIKLLTSLAGFVALSSVISPTLTSCGCSQTKYKVTFNTSDGFTVTEDKQQSGAYRWTIKATEDYELLINNTKVTIGGKEYKDFWFVKNVLYIPTKDVNGDVEITIVTQLINGADVDSDGVLRGFKAGLTEADIKRIYGNTLTIPAKAKTIAEDAFYDKENNVSTIPSFIKYLKFPVDSQLQGVVDTSTEPWTGTPAIGKNAFRKAPIEHVEFPNVKDLPYSIGDYAFEGSNIKSLNVTVPQFVEDDNLAWWEDSKDPFTNSDISLFEAYIKSRGMQTIGDSAFANCKNLKTFVFSPFLHNIKNGAFNIDENEKKTSNIKSFDFTNILCVVDNHTYGRFQTVEYMVKYLDDLYSKFSNNNSWFNTTVLQNNIFTPLHIKNESTSDRFYFLNYGYNLWRGDSAGNTAKINKFSEVLSLYPISGLPQTDDYYNAYDQIDLINNDPNLKDDRLNPLNNLEFENNDISISLSASENSNYFTKLHYSRNSSGEGNVPLKYENVDFEILNANWKTGKSVDIKLSQITESVDPDYNRNGYKVSWSSEAVPEVNSEVELTVKIHSDLFDRVSDELKLNIKFVA